MRPCLGCGRLIASGSRCRRCRHRNGSTRRWRKLRLQILVRDNWRCFGCRGRATEVHHLTPVEAGGTDNPSNLAASCTSCHRPPDRLK